MISFWIRKQFKGHSQHKYQISLVLGYEVWPQDVDTQQNRVIGNIHMDVPLSNIMMDDWITMAEASGYTTQPLSGFLLSSFNPQPFVDDFIMQTAGCVLLTEMSIHFTKGISA